MLRIATVLGARPQFIKSKPLSDHFSSDPNIEEIVIHTGQHYDFSMYQTFLDELDLPKPKHYLGIQGGTNSDQLSRMISRLEEVFNEENPDLVIIYGDTNSTLAGSLCARLLKKPICHIEAGLRSYNWDMAEEINRILTDRISDLLFTPVVEANENLTREGISENVYHVGDPLLDVLNQHTTVIQENYNKIADEVQAIADKDYVFMTLHRAEMVDDKEKFNDIIEILGELDVKMVFPIHPRTKKNLSLFKIDIPSNIILLEPQPYFSTLGLIKNSKAVITDSGGVQREAYMLKKKCFTLRNETEWTGTLNNNCNTLLTIDPSTIKSRLSDIHSDTPLRFDDIFGDGNAAGKIHEHIKSYFSK